MVEGLVQQIEQSFAEVERELSDPAVTSDRRRMADLGRRHKQLGDANALAQRWRAAREAADDARGMLEAGESDGEMGAYLEAEASENAATADALEDELRLAMVERDPNDDRDVIVEVRAGAGGDEAALFAGDIFRMLTGYAQSRGFKIDVLSSSPSEAGGFKTVTFAVKGDAAYSLFKWESGVHRVQRVPQTETQGRIHTSTASVAVLPEAEEVDVQIDPKDLKID